VLITVGRRLDELQKLLDSILRKLEFVFLACLVRFMYKNMGLFNVAMYSTVLLGKMYQKPLL
jgi:hypothetical protein